VAGEQASQLRGAWRSIAWRLIPISGRVTAAAARCSPRGDCVQWRGRGGAGRTEETEKSETKWS